MARTREAVAKAWALKKKRKRAKVFARKFKDLSLSWCSNDKDKEVSKILRLYGFATSTRHVARTSSTPAAGTADPGETNVLEKIDFGGSASRSLAAYGDLFEPENRAMLEKSGIWGFAQLELVPVNRDACVAFLTSFDGSGASMEGKKLKLDAVSVARAFQLPNSGEEVGAQCLQDDTIEDLFGCNAKCAEGYVASELEEIKELARFLNKNVDIRDNGDIVSKEILSASWDIFELNAVFNWAAVLAKRLREDCTLAVNGKLASMSHCAQFLTHFIYCELGWGLDMGSSLEPGSKVQPFPSMSSKNPRTLLSEDCEVECLGPYNVGDCEQHNEKSVAVLIEEAVNEARNGHKKEIAALVEAANKGVEAAKKEAEAAAKKEVNVIKEKASAALLECQAMFQRFYACKSKLDEEMRNKDVEIMNLKVLIAKFEEESHKKDKIIEEVQKKDNESREGLKQLEKGVNLYISQLRNKYKLDRKSLHQ